MLDKCTRNQERRFELSSLPDELLAAVRCQDECDLMIAILHAERNGFEHLQTALEQALRNVLEARLKYQSCDTRAPANSDGSLEEARLKA